MASRYYAGETQALIAPVLTAQAVAIGDLVGLSSGNVVRAEDITWDTDLATTQEDFVPVFLGVAAQRKDATVARVPGNSEDNVIRIDTDGVFEFDCASASFNVGDLVGPAKQTGNALESQKVAAVASAARAIGRVWEKTTSSTKVKVKLISTLMP